MNEIGLDRLEAARLIVPHCSRMDLFLIGCGGTGSWLAPAVARVARLLKEKFTKDARVCFVDPDSVEEKNIYRQNFCRAEVNSNKAIALAVRYGTAWGVDIVGVPQKFSRSVIERTAGGSRFADTSVLIGCVDNRSARRDIQNAVRNHPGAAFWLDCGNVKESGQVLIGRNNPEKEVKTFPIEGMCAWLPLPSVQHKELVVGKDDEEEEQHQEEAGLPPPVSQGLSCADIALRDEQGLTINQAVAAVAADYLVRLLLTDNLDKFQTYLDLNSGSMQSISITPANVGKWRRR